MSIKTNGEIKPVSESGFLRDDKTDKLNFDLIPVWFLERLARLYTDGAKARGKNNWLLASNEKDLESFRESAWRHFIQYMKGDRDEDHMMAVVFNLVGSEYVKNKIANNIR